MTIVKPHPKVHSPTTDQRFHRLTLSAQVVGLQFGLQLSLRVAPQRPADFLGCVGHDLGQDVGVPGGHADL